MTAERDKWQFDL